MLRRAVLLSVLFASTCTGLVLAQGGSEDYLRFKTAEGVEETKRGEVKESAAGVELWQNGKKAFTVLPNRVISISYGKLAGVDDKTRREFEEWDKKGGAEARKNYSDLLKTVSTGGAADERTKRVLEFRAAMWAARLADAKVGDEFVKDATAAAEALALFARGAGKSWEVWPAFRTAARLQTEAGKFNDAAATLAALAKVEGLPAELKGEARLAEAEVLFRSGSALTAGPVIDALGKTASTLTAPQQARVQVYQAAMKGLQEKTDPAKVRAAAVAVRAVLDKTTDPVAKAAGHNVLGQLFASANLHREAMWEYLWVEAVYNQDRDEVLTALSQLAVVFDKQGDKDRAAAYREKLQKAKAG